jgi:hypothetical protein
MNLGRLGVGWLIPLVVSAGLVAAALPRVWPHLFPAPPPPEGTAGTPAAPERCVAAWERALRTGGGDPSAVGPVELPRGFSPRELQAALRLELQADGVDAYVSEVEPLLYRARLVAGASTCLQRELRPYLPEMPEHGPSVRPALAMLFVLPNPTSAALDPLLDGRDPLAVALPPFAPGTLLAARDIVRSGRDLLLLADPFEPLRAQFDAVPGASGALVEAAPAIERGAWLSGVEGRLLIDATPAGQSLPGALRAPAALGTASGAKLARNLAVVRGGAVVLVPADARDRAREFVAASREGGFRFVFPSELPAPPPGDGALTVSPSPPSGY